MNPFMKVWFWLLILSIIGFIIAFITFESSGQGLSNNTSTPAWVWIILIISFVFLIASFVLYVLDLSAYHRRVEIAEACGELPPPPPKKKMKCPKKECEKKPACEKPKPPCEEPKPPCEAPKKECIKPSKLPVAKETIIIETDGIALPKGVVLPADVALREEITPLVLPDIKTKVADLPQPLAPKPSMSLLPALPKAGL